MKRGECKIWSDVIVTAIVDDKDKEYTINATMHLQAVYGHSERIIYYEYEQQQHEQWPCNYKI